MLMPDHDNPGAATKKSPRNHEDEPPRRRHTCLLIVLTTVFFLCLIVVAGVRWLSNRMVDRLDPDKRTTLLTADTTIIHLPDDWHQPGKPVARDILAYHDYFGREVSRLIEDESLLLSGDKRASWKTVSERDEWATRALLTRQSYDVPPIDDDQRASFSLVLARLQPIIDATTSITARADYTPEKGDGEFINFLAWQQFAKLMRTKAMVELADGQCSTALESATLPFKMTRRPAQVNLITHLVAIAMNMITVESMVAIADQCPDAAVLHQALQMMAEQRGTATAITPEQLPYAESFSILHGMARTRVPVNMKPQSVASINRQVMWSYSEKYCLWQISNLPPGDPRISKAQALLASMRSSSGGRRIEHKIISVFQRHLLASDPTKVKLSYALVADLLGFDPATYYFVTIGAPNFAEACTRAIVAQARYDLARLRLAQQLALVEGKMDMATSPTASAPAVAEYINPMPLDPFTSAPFKLSPQGQFYSLGPDKTDDHAATPYDPTNGTFSPGDIYFLPPKDPNGP